MRFKSTLILISALLSASVGYAEVTPSSVTSAYPTHALSYADLSIRDALKLMSVSYAKMDAIIL